jgi:serine/threonine protein kinase
MGVVYRAYDEKLQRDVAIKLLHCGPDDSGRGHILHEARTSSALNHPGISTGWTKRSRGWSRPSSSGTAGSFVSERILATTGCVEILDTSIWSGE